MSEMRDEMLRTLDRIVEDTVTIAVREAADERASGGRAGGAEGFVAAPLWKALEEAGITAIGAGGDDDVAFADAMELVRRAGYHALPVPVAETIIARRVLTRAGIAAPEGAMTLAPPGAGPLPTFADGKLAGTAKSVPYGRSSGHVLVATLSHLHLVDAREAVAARGSNIAGEPSDTIDLARARLVARAPVADADAIVAVEGALVRAVQLSGALSAALDHSLTWVNDRIQFGRPIAKHQAVQHLMAQLAEEAAAAGAAADLAIEASASAPDLMAVAIAKSRTGEAAGKAANIAHAAFGAMGFTREHALHYTTRRLWSWRNEFGSEVHWQTQIGRAVAAAGGRGLWPWLTRAD
ncbi:MAG: acyl-CoA dehydrogenase family protein [Hyphomicrobiaceae bacterium]|nr:acyl-CoA dehydrogenase family protein [Hyphomicrobiaceae bacterium]